MVGVGPQHCTVRAVVLLGLPATLWSYTKVASSLRFRLAEGHGRPAGSGASPWDSSRATFTTSHGGGDLGYRLLAAGLLVVSGAIDYDRLGGAVQAAYDQASDDLEDASLGSPRP